MSKIEEQLINKIRSRAAAGKQKYGTTMERNDLSNAEWLKHLQEELMDAAIYAEKLLTLIEIADEEPVKCPIPLNEWPKWAKWAAMDKNESWYFYQTEPEIRKKIWVVDSELPHTLAEFKGSDFPWHETLTHRSELENQNQ